MFSKPLLDQRRDDHVVEPRLERPDQPAFHRGIWMRPFNPFGLDCPAEEPLQGDMIPNVGSVSGRLGARLPAAQLQTSLSEHRLLE